MTSSPAQIRELLLKSINKDDKTVLDMEGVMRAISALEKLTLTKEALEKEHDDGTRLGRLVNDIRKAATSKKLKNQCKRLIQKWNNQFVGSKDKSKPGEVSSPTTSQLNQNSASSQSPKVSPPASRPPIKTRGTPVDQTKSENRKRRKPDSPATPPDIQQPSKKQSVDKDSKKCISDSPKDGYKGSKGKKVPDVSTKEDYSSTTNVSPKTGRAKPGRGREGAKESKSLYKQVVHSSAIKVADENDTGQSGAKLKDSKKRKSPKVAKLNFISKGNGSTSSSPAAYLQNEETQESFLGSPVSLFDETSQSPDSFSVQEDRAISSDRAESSIFDIKGATEGSIVDELNVSSVPDSPAESLHHQETLDSESSQHSTNSNKMSEIVEDVRTLNKEDNLIEDERLIKKEIDEDTIRRLHLEHWEGVNGNYNSNGDWSSWNDCVVMDSGGGNNLHILPYVCID